ncbi:MAG: response regulator, partial [Verrucomicrobiota bacterium]
MNAEKYKVFLVDDSMDDRFFVRLLLERTKKFTIIEEARDGNEAIDYFKKEGKFSEKSTDFTPDLVLLDLKMPKKNGFDVLEWIQSQALKSFL